MNKKTKLAGLLVGLAQFIAVGAAHATDPVDFEGAGSSIGYTSLSFVRDGFTFSNTSSHTVTASSAPVSNGTNYLAFLAADAGFETFSVASATPTPFNLTSIDLWGWVNFGNPSLSPHQTLTVTGFKSGGSMVTAHLDVTYSIQKYDPNAFVVIPGTSFTNLLSVQLGGLDRGYVAMDNIVTTPVPEPETYAMFLAGLGLMATIARRRKAS